jgi:O-acetyl-ADP-ribose deacetylase (regulator of RNase III)
MKYQETEGNLIKMAQKGDFQVIAHGVNCFCRMKRGIAPQMANAFGCDYFPMERPSSVGDINKLGQIDFRHLYLEDNNKFCETINKIPIDFKEGVINFVVVNAYTQYYWNTETKPLDYEALRLCMRKINHIFKEKHIGLPLIGCHLAGGVWDYEKIIAKTPEDIYLYEEFGSGRKKDVKTIIQEELKDMNITIVHYKP